MLFSHRLPVLALATLIFGAPLVAGAQESSPQPPASAEPAATESAAPASAPTSAPAPAPSASHAAKSAANAKVKKIKTGTLSVAQAIYGVTHPVAEANKLRSMGTVNFDNLRVYKLSSVLKLRLHVAAVTGPAVALDDAAILVAQTLPSVNGSNSPIQYLHQVLANINVSNALNNVLNNSTLNVSVPLTNVLNNNKISIGQVVGLYIGGGGIITTITK